MQLTIKSKGDESVGLFPQTWSVDVPFDIDDNEQREAFRTDAVNLFEEYADDRCEGWYDDEEIDEQPTGGYYETYAAFLSEDKKRREWASE